MFRRISGHLRATRRAAALIGTLLGCAVIAYPLQKFFMGPVLRNYETIPRICYKLTTRLTGIRVVFNKASAPLERGKQAVFVGNHQSILDPFVLGSVTGGVFVAAPWIKSFPIISHMCNASKIVFITRGKPGDSEEKRARDKAMDNGKVIDTLNRGDNIVIFPEGRTNDGGEVDLFRKAMFEMHYGQPGLDQSGNDVRLKAGRDIVIQPVAIRVLSVGGESAIGNAKLRETYSQHYAGGILTNIWRRMMAKSIAVEITAFNPLSPKDYPDAEALINAASWKIRRHVAPGQTDVQKPQIGIPAKPSADKNSRPFNY